METQIENKPAATGVVLVAGKEYMPDAKGNLVPVSAIKTQHLMEDEVVRKIIGFAIPLAAQVRRFREHSFADLAKFDRDLEEHYGLVKRGRKGKGNVTYMTVDGLMKVEVKTADDIVFGPELQVAKGLIDECLIEWSAESRPEIQTIIANAFDTEKEGKINRSAIYMLLRYDSDDPRWQRAMNAIRDSMKIVGRREYIRFGIRETPSDDFTSITINIADA
mgnify:CR=1 FL=1